MYSRWVKSGEKALVRWRGEELEVVEKAALSQRITLPHSPLSQRITLPHSPLSQRITLPHSPLSQRITLPHSPLSQRITLPHSSLSQRITLPHSPLSQRITLPHSPLSQRITLPHSPSRPPPSLCSPLALPLPLPPCPRQALSCPLPTPTRAPLPEGLLLPYPPSRPSPCPPSPSLPHPPSRPSPCPPSPSLPHPPSRPSPCPPSPSLPHPPSRPSPCPPSPSLPHPPSRPPSLPSYTLATFPTHHHACRPSVAPISSSRPPLSLPHPHYSPINTPGPQLPNLELLCLGESCFFIHSHALPLCFHLSSLSPCHSPPAPARPSAAPISRSSVSEAPASPSSLTPAPFLLLFPRNPPPAHARPSVAPISSSSVSAVPASPFSPTPSPLPPHSLSLSPNFATPPPLLQALSCPNLELLEGEVRPGAWGEGGARRRQVQRQVRPGEALGGVAVLLERLQLVEVSFWEKGEVDDMRLQLVEVSFWEKGEVDDMRSVAGRGRLVVSMRDKGGATALFLAAEAGDAWTVEGQLVVSMRDKGGATALFLAAEAGDAWTVEVLLQAGADMAVGNRGEETPLYIASFKGHLCAVCCSHAFPPPPPGAAASRRGHGSGQQGRGDASLHRLTQGPPVLLQAGADMAVGNRGEETPLYIASLKGHLCCCKQGRTWQWATGARRRLSTSPHSSAPPVLLQAGADMAVGNRGEETPLYIASLKGHLWVVRRLLGHCRRRGIDWQADASLAGEGPPVGGATAAGALQEERAGLAGRCESPQGRRLLGGCRRVDWQADASTHRGGSGWTPLMAAALSNHTHVLHTLLTHHVHTHQSHDDTSSPALINKQNAYGLTALHIAARYGSLDCIQALLAAGACAAVPDLYGERPSGLAKRFGHSEAVQMLLVAEGEMGVGGGEDGGNGGKGSNGGKDGRGGKGKGARRKGRKAKGIEEN
ncbi:unnamed protein product [Closterium sp. Naga37s-1]|nr:unnamed protein product [Closterium sp. Naga37s-1]